MSKLGRAGRLGVVKVRLVYLLRLIPGGGGEGSAQPRKNGAYEWYIGRCPSSSLPKATHLSLSLYVSGTLQAAVPPPEAWVSACKQDFVCCPFERMPEFPATFCLLQGRQNPC